MNCETILCSASQKTSNGRDGMAPLKSINDFEHIALKMNLLNFAIEKMFQPPFNHIRLKKYRGLKPVHTLKALRIDN